MLALAAGTFTHLLLDEMWQTPITLFWPILGFIFPTIELEGWASNIWESIFSDPRVYIPEIVGLMILLVLAVCLLKRRGLVVFIKRGKVS